MNGGGGMRVGEESYNWMDAEEDDLSKGGGELR